MSPLAHRVYTQLVRQLRRARRSVTYGELAVAVDVHHRSPQLYAALGEVSDACRDRALPCVPAIVWRADRERPSDGYFKAAHPRARTDRARVVAWEREYARVLEATRRYPARLE